MRSELRCSLSGFFRGQSGFSLPDLLLGLTLTGLLAGAVFGVYQVSQGSYLAGAARAEMQENARVVLDRIATELRQAYAPSSFTLTAASTADVLAFSFDCNNNGVLADGGESVQYSLTAGSVVRQCSTGGNEPIIDGVQGLTFTYLNLNGVLIPTPLTDATRPNVRAVVISVTLQRAATVSSSFGPSTSKFVTQVRFRNAS